LPPLLPPRFFDACLALGAALVGVAGEYGNMRHDPHVLTASAILAVMGLALAGRRLLPGTVLAVVAVGVVTMSVLRFSLEAGFVTVLVACYSAAVYGTRRLAAALVAAGIAIFAGTAVASAFGGRLPGGAHPPLTTLLAAAGAWLVGFVIRRQLDLRAAQVKLANEAAELTAERQREEAHRARLAERLRIARELHDVVAHHISVAVIQAQGAQRIAEHDPARAVAAMAEVERTGRSALDEMRRLLGLLRSGEPDAAEAAAELTAAEVAASARAGPDVAWNHPAESWSEPDATSATWLAHPVPPGLGDIEALAERMRSAGLDVAVRTNGEPCTVPADVGLAGYRIVQEALTNALKHAGPAHVAVWLDFTGGLTIQVADDGRGAAAALDGARVPGAGTGLTSMAERARAVGGTLIAGPRPGGGFRVHASIPVVPEAREAGGVPEAREAGTAR